jgi:hypothetical protein
MWILEVASASLTSPLESEGARTVAAGSTVTAAAVPATPGGLVVSVANIVESLQTAGGTSSAAFH